MEKPGPYLLAFFLLLGSAIFMCPALAQNSRPDASTKERTKPSGQERIVKGQVVEGDTLAVVELPEVRIYERKDFEYLYLKRRYRRLIRNVKRAYPYARIAAGRLNKLDQDLWGIDSKKERKVYIEQAEKEIMDEFEKEIRQLTITQGIILVKLIDRETGRTSYTVIQELKGRLTAFFWQGIARLFGNNLKTEYDPYGQDRVIEDIVRGIEAGFI